MPTLTLTASNTSACAGSSFTLSASGADSYTWQPGNKTGNTVSYTESSLGIKTYTAYGTSATGEVGSQSISINTAAAPVAPRASASAAAICLGDSVTLNAAVTGINSYTFGTAANTNDCSYESPASTHYPAPYSHLGSGAQRMQMLILASELRAAGFIAGSAFNSIQFPIVATGCDAGTDWSFGNPTNVGTFLKQVTNFQISIGTTTLSSISSFQNNLITVCPANGFKLAPGYDNTHTFDTPFVWDGTSNLIIQTSFYNPTYDGSDYGAITQYNSPTNFGSCILYVPARGAAKDKVATCDSVKYQYNARPDFLLRAGLNLAWSPSKGLSDTTNPTVKASPARTTTYSLIAYNGVCATASNPLTITTNSLPTISALTVPTMFCAGKPLNLTAPQTTSSNNTIITAQGWYLNETPISATTTLSISDDGKILSYRATNGCGTSISNTVAINVNTLPSIAPISAPTAICSGKALTLTTPQVTTIKDNTVTVQGWYLNGSAINNTTTLTVADNAHTLTYQATNACGTTTSNSVTVTVNDVPTSTITAEASICSGNTLKLTDPKVMSGLPIISEKWFVGSYSTGTWTPITNSSALTRADNGKTLVCQVQNACGSRNSNSVTISVNDVPAISPLTTPAPMCAGSTLGAATPQIDSNGADLSTQGWYLGGTAFSTTNTVNVGHDGKGLYYKATNACGTSNSNTVTIAVSNSLISITPISAPPAICAGNSLSLSDPQVSASGITITSKNWMLNGSPLTNTTTLSFSDNGKSLTYQVIGSSCNGSSNAVSITVNDVPAVSPISTPTLLCAGNPLAAAPSTNDNGATITAQGWYLNDVAVANTTTLAVSDNGKTLLYKATNACGTSASNTLTLSIKPSPTMTATAASTLICLGNAVVLTASSDASSYLWAPGGATTASVSVSPSSTTTYTVVGTNSLTCSTSSVVLVTVSPCTGIEEAASERSLTLFPNPSKGLLSLEMKGLELGKSHIHLVLYDLKGQLMFQQNIHALSTPLNLGELAKGMYFIEVRADQQVIFRNKIVLED